MLVLIAALQTVQPTVRECNILQAAFVIVDEGKNTPPKPKEIWEELVSGCKKKYGPQSCPSVIQYKASNGHMSVTCEGV